MHLSIVSAESLQLDALLESLAELENPPKVDLVGISHASQSSLYAGRSLAFEVLEDYDFSVCDAALLLTDALAVEASVSLLADASCKVFAWQSSAHLLEAIDKDRVQFIANPYVQAIAQIFEALPSEIIVERLVMTALLPSSLYGKEGVEELAAQTAKLLNGQALEDGVFGSQMTFNYFPADRNSVVSDFTTGLKRELNALFLDADVILTPIQMPIFHGYGANLSFELASGLTVSDLSEALQGEDCFDVLSHEESLSGLAFANAGHKIIVGHFAQPENDLHQVNCWLGFDEAKFGVANNWISAIVMK
jgi:aspartate-semialdehyde dehydrogenase